MATIVLPDTLANGDPVDADVLQDLLDAIVAGLGSITNSDIRTGAAIDSAKLSRSRTTPPIVVPVVPYTQDATLDGTPVQYNCDTTLRTVARTIVRLAADETCELVAVDLDVRAFAGSGGNFPQLNVLVDGVQLGGAVVDVDSTGFFSITSSFSAPFFPISDGAIIEFQVGAGGASCTISGVTATIHLKKGLAG